MISTATPTAPTVTAQNRIALAGPAMHTLRHFISDRQRATIGDIIRRGEEGVWFAQRMVDLAEIVAHMPATYKTDGTPADDRTAWLRYFAGGQAAFHIIEKDAGHAADATPGAQLQAYGHADLYGDGGELGYISLPEIFAAGGELDLHYEPKTLGEIRHI